jgi:hypothetical protein
MSKNFSSLPSMYTGTDLMLRGYILWARSLIVPQQFLSSTERVCNPETQTLEDVNGNNGNSIV